MRTFWKQLWPYLILLSFIGNIYFADRTYNDDHMLNLYTWGNAVDQVWKSINELRLDIEPRSDGRVLERVQPEIVGAMDSLEALRSLPTFSRRVGQEDLQTLEQFLRYANGAYATAAREQGDHGTMSQDSVKRLTQVSQAAELALHQQAQTNALKLSRYPWNYAGWRAVWHNIALELRSTDFLPLPQ